MTGFSLQGRMSAFRKTIQTNADAKLCELCATEIPKEHHDHLIEPASGQLKCSCHPCALLFSTGHKTKFKRVPQQATRLDAMSLTQLQWQSLQVPINLLFLTTKSQPAQKQAFYPSAAGAVECTFAEDLWSELRQWVPVIDELTPDIEALLIYEKEDSIILYRLSIDLCFQLIGLIRMHWRGFSGGADVYREISQFFENLDSRTGNDG